MRRALGITITAGLLLTGCGGDDNSDSDSVRPVGGGEEIPAGWLDQWEGVDRIEEHDGRQVGIDDDRPMIYVEDCDLAEQLTVEGAPFGPSPRDPETGDYVEGYGSICAD